MHNDSYIRNAVLGLDLSSVNTGYSVFKGPSAMEGAPATRVNETFELQTYGNITPNKNLNEQAKLQTIYSLVKQIIQENEVNVVAVEDTYYSKNAKTFKILVRISGIVLLAANECECEIYMYAPSEVKKEFTGSGKASKKDMVDKVIEVYKIDKDNIDHNAADAIAVGHTHLAKDLSKEN